MPIPKALTIAGSDSGGGAGIQADLKTFAAFGVYGCSVITAITAQNTRQVTGVEPVSPDMVRKQLEAVLSDIRPDVLKTGMLANAGIIRAVASSLSQTRRIPLVLDPVMVSKSGDALLAEDSAVTLRELLFPLADLITPNIPEAEVLTGKTLKTDQDFEEAARQLHRMGARAVLLKGGHRPETSSGRGHGTARSGRSPLRWSGVPLHPRPLGEHSTHARHGLHAGLRDCGRSRTRVGASSSCAASARLPHQGSGSGICDRTRHQPGASFSPLVDGESCQIWWVSL